MAEREVNKVTYGGRTLIDLTGDTVTADALALGVTAHAANGEEVVGTLDTYSKTEIDNKLEDYIQNGTSEDVQLNGNVAVSNGGLLNVVEVTLTSNASIAANNGTKDGTVAVNSPTGFSPVAVVGYTISGTRHVYFYRLVLTNGNVEYSLRNTNSSAVTITVTAQVLCVRTSL